jgi:glycosyltransferase involved in cell wall biosynthesis
MKRVYLHVWTGDVTRAQEAVTNIFGDCEIRVIGHRELRGNGIREQIRAFRRLRGYALLYYFEAPQDNRHPGVVAATHLLHRCRRTVVAYGNGKSETYTRSSSPRLLLRLLSASALDVATLAAAWLWLKLERRRLVPVEFPPDGSAQRVAYLFPFPLHRFSTGGAVSHIRGVIGGLLQNRATVEVYTGSELPINDPKPKLIPLASTRFVSSEAATLRYNLTFARGVRADVTKFRPSMLYQRHGRFVLAGALLSRWLKIPLVLEYNGSEQWMARHWDPTRFRKHLELCECVALRAATKIVVVAEPLIEELAKQGVARERIVLNPNAVDPDVFRPDCGGAQLREELGFNSDDVVCGFVGTFNYWHGVSVLEEAIRRVLTSRSAHNIRFLLVGDGPLRAEMAARLMDWSRANRVVFSGTVPHDSVHVYLDAMDILLSPHVPLPDGRAFFGSPTKLFEYMATGKCVIASALDQIADVLTHMETAMLVTPGDVAQLETAIMCAVGDPELRMRLGKNVRRAAVLRHTWKQNAARVLVLADNEIDERPARAVSGDAGPIYSSS